MALSGVSFMLRLFKQLFGRSKVEQPSPCEEGHRRETKVEHAQAQSESVAQEQSESAVGAAHAYLELASGEGKTFPITADVVTIGSGEGCELRIDESYPHHESVSGRHARIERWRDMWVIKDLTGKGIFVNGRRTGENALYDGYRIRLGELEFVFHEARVANESTTC